MVLGMPLRRVVGQATYATVGNVSAAADFMTALAESFSEQYAMYNLSTQLSTPAEAASASITPAAGGSACLLLAWITFVRTLGA